MHVIDVFKEVTFECDVAIYECNEDIDTCKINKWASIRAVDFNPK